MAEVAEADNLLQQVFTWLRDTASVKLLKTYLHSLGMTSVSVSDRNTSP